jgi:hypothetical protein
VKLIFLYGPHAVGKYTVGQALAERTKYKLFHNQYSVDMVKSIFPERDHPRSECLKAVRIFMLGKAAEYGRDTIFTLAYSGRVDDDFVSQVVAAAERHEGQVCFVRLTAPVPVLLDRVGNSSRVKARKISSQADLQQVLATRDMDQFIPRPGQLSIDTSQMSPERAAARIKSHYHLAVVG